MLEGEKTDDETRKSNAFEEYKKQINFSMARKGIYQNVPVFAEMTVKVS